MQHTTDNAGPDNLVISNDCPASMHLSSSPITVTWTIFDPDSNQQITTSAQINISASNTAPLTSKSPSIYQYDPATAQYQRRGNTNDPLSELIDLDDE